LEEDANEGGSLVEGGNGIEEGVVVEADGLDVDEPPLPDSVASLAGAFDLSVEDVGRGGATEESQRKIALGTVLMRKCLGIWSA
jgi:hypothetical protein